MRYKAPCPICGEPVSALRIMIAPTPFGFKCSKCGKKFYAKGWTAQTVIIALFIIGSLGWGLNYLLDTEQISSSSAFAIFLGVFVLGEIIYSLLVINKGTLVARR